MKRFIRSVLLAGIATLAISGLGSGLFTSSAAASGHCSSSYDACAWANAYWEGGTHAWPNQFLYYVHSFTELASVSGCTHVGFNDCVSSIDNNGPNVVYYYKEAECRGGVYTNNAGTGTNYIGEFWNDTFSSMSEGSEGSC